MQTATKSQIIEAYIRKTPSSRDRYAQALDIFPSGVTHDVRYLRPHPVYIDRADGSRKWDIDGNCYVDYFGGHGAQNQGAVAIRRWWKRRGNRFRAESTTAQLTSWNWSGRTGSAS